jgi:hypothetical protein
MGHNRLSLSPNAPRLAQGVIISKFHILDRRTMASLYVFLGSLVPTFLLSQLFLWLLKRIRIVEGYQALFAASALSLSVAATISKFNLAEAMMSYVPAQVIWLLVGITLHAMKANKAEKGEREWNEKVEEKYLRCYACKKPPSYLDRTAFLATGMCISCAQKRTEAKASTP